MLCSKRNDVVLAEPHLRGNGEKERKSGERDMRGMQFPKRGSPSRPQITTLQRTSESESHFLGYI